MQPRYRSASSQPLPLSLCLSLPRYIQRLSHQRLSLLLPLVEGCCSPNEGPRCHSPDFPLPPSPLIRDARISSRPISSPLEKGLPPLAKMISIRNYRVFYRVEGIRCFPLDGRRKRRMDRSGENSFPLQQKTGCNVRRKKERCNGEKFDKIRETIHILLEQKNSLVIYSLSFLTRRGVYISLFSSGIREDIEKAQPWHHAPLALQSSF